MLYMELTSVTGLYCAPGRPYEEPRSWTGALRVTCATAGEALELWDGVRRDLRDDGVDQTDVLLDMAAERRDLLIRGGALSGLRSHDHRDEVRAGVGGGGQRAGAQQDGSGSRHRADRATLAIVPADAVYRSHPLAIPLLVPTLRHRSPASDSLR